MLYIHRRPETRRHFDEVFRAACLFSGALRDDSERACHIRAVICACLYFSHYRWQS